MFESSKVGERPATRVRINNPQGSRDNGRTGVVARIVEGPGTLFVRFSKNGPAIPFARSEVEEVR